MKFTAENKFEIYFLKKNFLFFRRKKNGIQVTRLLADVYECNFLKLLVLSLQI